MVKSRVIFFTTAVLILGGIARAQSADSLWSRNYGGIYNEYGYSLLQTPDSGYSLAGYTNTFGVDSSYDFWLLKTDRCGDSLWSHTYGGINTDACMAHVRTLDGGYALAGYTYSFGPGTPSNSNFWLVKTNASGSSLWSRYYGGNSDEFCFALIQTSDSGYALAGRTSTFSVGAYDLWLMKTNANGDSVWSRNYGGSSGDECYSVQQTADGGYILAGSTLSFGAGGQPNFYLVKTNSNGDTLWTRRFGGSGSDVARCVRQTPDGGYVIAGFASSYGMGNWDGWVLKIDSGGDSLWSQTYGGTDADQFFTFQPTSEGGYVFAGQTASFGAGYKDYWLVKTDAVGTQLWSRTFGGYSAEECMSVCEAVDGGFALGGYASSFNPNYAEFWLLKADYQAPQITSIGDVGNDQGRQVRIRWQRSSYDNVCAGGTTITGYSLYRRIDQYRQRDVPRATRATLDWPPGEWEYIRTVPARGEGRYAAIAPTLADSASDGIYWSVFFVSAETDDPLTYFDSVPDSGYSMDNLPPDETVLTIWAQPTPTGLLLRWDPVATGGDGQPEQGDVWYRIYGSTNVSFTPGPATLLHTTQQTEFLHVTTAETFHYIVTASDDH